MAKQKNAIEILKADHKVVRKLLNELDKAEKASRRNELLKQIAQEITVTRP